MYIEKCRCQKSTTSLYQRKTFFHGIILSRFYMPVENVNLLKYYQTKRQINVKVCFNAFKYNVFKDINKV